MRFIDPDGMFADFFDVDGKKIGTDGIKNDQRLVVTDKNQAKQVEATNKAGGTTQIDDVSSAQFLPSTALLNQSMKVLDAQVKGTTPNEKLPSLVTPTGTVIEGPTGGAPVVTTNSKGNPEVTVPAAVPAAPAGTTAYGSYVNTTIHPHPTTGFTIGTAQFSAIPASGTLDAADASAFANHQTNIIVGRIGGSNGSLGIAIYHETTPVLNLTQKAVQKILTGN